MPDSWGARWWTWRWFWQAAVIPDYGFEVLRVNREYPRIRVCMRICRTRLASASVALLRETHGPILHRMFEAGRGGWTTIGRNRGVREALRSSEIPANLICFRFP
jgi:hypothetical protein